MICDIRISQHAVFSEGFFEKHPALLDVYRRNRLNREETRLAEYEKRVTWHHISGPGFCGATHPGAGKCFNRLMTGVSNPVYNSDCLYVHTGLRVFAVSDPPGATTISRRLFAELDKRLESQSPHRLDALIHDIAAGIDANRQPTLALIHVVKNGSLQKPDKAFVFIAGDTEVYHGNLHQNRLTRINGCAHFWGTAYRHFSPRWVDLAPGDFFIIASDGIRAVRPGVSDKSMEDVLLAHVQDDPKNFAYNVMSVCNRIYEESCNGSARTLLGGHDDMTVLLVSPLELACVQPAKAAILGGQVGL